jgi:hypothetical protein
LRSKTGEEEMMKTLLQRFVVAAALTLVASSAPAGTVLVATLNGGHEVPPNVSPGLGEAEVVLNAAKDSISVTLDWQGLLAGATSAAIHDGAPGETGLIEFALQMGNGAGTTVGSIDPSPQVFSITSGQVADLQAGRMYVEVTSSVFPAGEIRGQVYAVPEPGTLVLAGTAIAIGLVAFGWRRRARRA